MAVLTRSARQAGEQAEDSSSAGSESDPDFQPAEPGLSRGMDLDDDDDEEDDSYVLEEDSDEAENADSTVVYVDSRMLHRSYLGFAGRNRGPSRQQFPPLPDTWPQVDTEMSREVLQDTSPVVRRQPFKILEEGGKAASPVSTGSMVRLRECHGLGNARPGFSPAQQRHLCCSHFLPQQPVQVVDKMQSRAYIGQFSHDGELFFAAFQHERRIKIYEVHNGWRVRKNVHARNLRWTVTDTALSPDGRFLLYASITPIANLVSVAAGGAVESQANVTDVHESLPFHLMVNQFEAPDEDLFGIWSICWAPNGQDVLAGTGKNSLDVFNLECQRCVQSIPGHGNDVNAVAFLSNTSSDVVVSGSDDCTLKVWDRRVPRSGAGTPRPEQELPGHVGGMTHIDTMGDGIHLLSTCKDQTSKLWDIRLSPKGGPKTPKGWTMPFGYYDYRCMDWPGRGRLVSHPADCSLQTYRGHHVLQTLVRAYFSPQQTTGRRFIYSGSADGGVRIWDLVSGKSVARLKYHDEMVRDCSWHPTIADQLVSVSWDGMVVAWGKGAGSGKQGESAAELPRPGHDLLEDYY